MKRNFAQKLFANRYILKPTYTGDTTELNKTLGEIPFVFSKNKEVIVCYKNLTELGSDDNLLKLIKAICNDKDVKIDISDWDDSLFLKVMNVG